jgi:arylsulfatase A-like enzyme
MAFRMQTSVPALRDLADESRKTLAMYGIERVDGTFASSCLMARRLAERGVRFIQLYHRDWDHHGAVKQHSQGTAAEVDQGAAALVKDLKHRGMLDETLVVWGGEFGRTPMVQGGADGRDHHPNAFTMWMAGGGIKAGARIGETDELGFNVTRDKVHVHDLHATMLKLLGFDHTRLTFKFQGRNFRLTDVSGAVVEQLIA